jgi:hypothetical protein
MLVLKDPDFIVGLFCGLIEDGTSFIFTGQGSFFHQDRLLQTSHAVIKEKLSIVKSIL